MPAVLCVEAGALPLRRPAVIVTNSSRLFSRVIVEDDRYAFPFDFAVQNGFAPLMSLSSEHRVPGLETFLRRLELGKSAAFLFNQEILNAAHRLRCCHQFFPRSQTFAKQNSISFVLRPIFEVHALDAARIRF